jgi:hypothetical protein
MSSELEIKIAKYQKAALACQSEVEKAQYMQLVKELEAQRPKPVIKLHVEEEALCTSCQ